MLDFFFMLHKKTTDAVLQLELLLCLTVSLAPEFVHWPSKDMIQKHHHEANTQILYVSKIDLIALFFFNNSKTKVNITKCNKAVFEIFISVVLYMYNIPNYNHKALFIEI